MAENFYGITNTGRIRDNNEDTFLAEKLPNGWIAACVIDGVGGYEGGEVAAEIARETLREKLQQQVASPLQLLTESLQLANQNIYNQKMQNAGQYHMACVLTVALVDVESNQFYYAHVGDTRLYLLRDQTLVKLTKDHSFVGFLEDSGRISERQAMKHPKRNEINKALGFDPQIDQKDDYIETGESPFLPGDMLLLCSDGLSDLVDRKTMTDILLSPRSLPQKGTDLVDEANTAGGKDNITVVLVHNNKTPLKLQATKPVAVKKNDGNEEASGTPAVSPPVNAGSSTPAKTKKGNPAVWILSALCLLLAGVCWWLWSRQNASAEAGTEPGPLPAYAPNDAEKRLKDSLYLAAGSFTLTDTAAGKTIRIGDTVFVRQDTLRINGNGLVLQRDSAYNGPALVATNNSKVLLLENITFSGFSTAIVWQGRGLQLRNVRFVQCAVPVQHHLYLPADSALNGTIRDSFLITRNALPQ